MKSWLRSPFSPHHRTNEKRQLVARSVRWKHLGLQRLEDRTVPASIITILDTGVGTLDGFLSATDGTILATDGGAVPGTLSRAALQGVGPTTNISITATDAIVVNDLTSSLALQTASGNSAQFDAGTGAFTFTDTSDSLTTAGGSFLLSAGTTATLGGLKTNNGFTDITADNIFINQTIDAGTAQVTLEPASAGQVINLGGADAAGTLGVTDAELSKITASVVRIGTLANNGGITISSAITRHAGYDTLTLVTDGPIGQTAPLSVAKAAIQSSGADVVLTNAANDVDFIAGTADTTFAYTDANGFDVSGVDIRAGIFLGSSDAVVLTAGGAVTQTANEIIHCGELLFLGTGSFTVTDPGNDVVTFAANVSGSVSYADSNGLTIGSVNGTDGVTTSTSLIAITASAEVTDTTLTVSQAIKSNNAAIVFSADHMSVAVAVDAGTSTARLKATTVATVIDLGSADAAGTLGLTDTELDFVSAGVIIIGDLTNTGGITITAAIDPSGTNQLELETGGKITDPVPQQVVTIGRLGMTAGTGIGQGGLEIQTLVDNIEATTNTGGIFVDQASDVTIGGVNGTLKGLNVVTSGAIDISTASGGITINEAVANTGSGNVTITAEDDLDVTSPISTTGSGKITLIAEPTTGKSGAAGNFSNSGTGTVTAVTGNILIQAGDSITLGAAVSTGGFGSISIEADAAEDGLGTFTNSGSGTLTTADNPIIITAHDASVGAAIKSTSSSVIFDARTVTQEIDLGTNSAGDFGLTDSELAFVTAKVLRVGSLSNTGGITISNAITRHAGYDTMTLITNGPIGQSAPLSVAKLAAQSSAANVILTNAGNDVDFLAGTADAIFNYTDANGFAVSGVDIRAGIFLGSSDLVILTAGGSVTQDVGEIVHCGDLLLLGTGPFAISDDGNDVNTLAADVTNSVSYSDSNGLTVGSVNGTNGVTTGGGTITIKASSEVSNTTLSVAKAIASGGSNIALSADNMNITSAVNAGAGKATLAPTTADTLIDLGGADASGTLGLSDAELDLVSATVLRIGNATTGAITVSAAISPDNTSVLSLQNSDSITNSIGGSITETNLAIRTSSFVTLDNPQSVTNLAANLTGTGLLSFNNGSSNLTVGSGIDGLSNIKAANGNVILTANVIQVPAGRSITSTTSDITLHAADDLLVVAGSSLTAGGDIIAVIDFGNPNPGTGATATVAGTISATSMTVTGNTDSDTFNITPSVTTPISIVGNNPIPPALPGDSLNVDISGTTGLNFTKIGTSSGFTGSFAFSNRQPVSYQEIESLSPDGTDLAVLMTDDPDPVFVGRTLTYSITVNIGNAEAQNVVLSDQLPAETTFVSLVAPAGWVTVTPAVGANGLVTATLGTLAGGSPSQVFTLVVRVRGNTPDDTIINNTAKVSTSTNEFDPSNNEASTATTAKAVLLPVVVGAGAGGSTQVNVYDPVTGAMTMSFDAYPGFGGGVQVTAGDINGDGIADIITGAGAGGGPHVKVFDGVTGAEIRSFFAYAATFTGGVFVAAGDVNNDGFDDIITGAGSGGGPHVTVVSGQDGKLLASFFAYDASFSGGVRVAAGDVNGDFQDDIITGAGPGGGPHVEVFSGANLALIRSFYAYAADFTGGVYVASGDMNDDGSADIITGAGAGGTSHTIVYSGATGAILQSFLAYSPDFAGGVRVGVADFGADGLLDLVTGAGPTGGPHVKVFNPTTLAEESSFFAFDPAFLGGVFVG